MNSARKTRELSLRIVKRTRKIFPMFLYEIFLIPSCDETEMKRLEISSQHSFNSPPGIPKRFAEGKINKGDKINIRGKSYVFLGANLGEIPPKCFLFFDEKEEVFLRFDYVYGPEKPGK